MIQAPERPTTRELHEGFPISYKARQQIAFQRRIVADVISGLTEGLIFGSGQCSTNIRDIATTHREAVEDQAIAFRHPGTLALRRLNNWKPRSVRDDGILPWFGMETTHPEEAYQLFTDVVNMGTPVCTELAYQEQARRYADGLSMAWVGARTDDLDFVLNLVIDEPELPLGIKNDIDGSFERANQTIELLQRDHWNSISPSFLIDRGGTSIHTPELWEQHILRQLEATEGAFMLDLAHGTEQAHDPAGKFEKSAEAEIRALEHYIQIGERTGMWARGLLLEASDAPSETDPNMPHHIALEGLAHIVSSMGFSN